MTSRFPTSLRIAVALVAMVLGYPVGAGAASCHHHRVIVGEQDLRLLGA